ncbi:SpaA isopeptide-forming pilin-related protein [Bifidobacterium simiiventris]|uniref:SpaA isopeptide-forming pilin-related protein n=1 Tax=Bifidobacterium simiiventris TaxID=2834434 RepID=UPI001C582E8B|nr:SpaA isopeptide-forming pilin-related protein [Bifidobacterium simiiventris]MBW3079668.1 LPXTG cell wall anchor domain-containing protein [Bifidobacterium simiiventris]
MNKIIKQALAGVAALGIAASGLALGAASAYAADPVTGTVSPEANGIITITGDSHTFSGYKLASLDSISYETKAGTTSMTGFTITTNSTYTSDIVEVLNGIEDSASKTTPKTTLGAEYSADTAYAGNPIGWLANKKYNTTNEIKAPWGGSTTGTDSELRQFATKLAAKLKNKTTDGTLNSSTSGAENSVAQGLWLLRDTTLLTDKQETASIPIIVSSTYKAKIGTSATEVKFDDGIGSITLKNTKPEVGKQVVKDNATAAQQAQGQHDYQAETVPDYYVGETVPYELSATLPYYTGYDIDPTLANDNKTRTFQILDTASAGLTVTEDSIESVKVLPLKNGTYDTANATTLVKNKDYTLLVTKVEYGTGNVGAANQDAGKNTATKIAINLGKYVNKSGSQTTDTTDDDATSVANGILEGGKVVVILKATLNKNALKSDPDNTQPNPNKVALEYSNNPENLENKHTTPGDEVNVYTYRFKIKKTDKGGKFDSALLTAEFKVKAPQGWLKSYDENTGWSFDSDESNGNVFKPTQQGAGDNAEAIIEGLVGLDSGTYTVKETKAPNGYSSLSLPEFNFTITPKGEKDADAPTKDEHTKNPWGQQTWGDFVIGDVTFSGLTGTDKVSGTGASFVTAAAKSGDEFQYTVYNAKNITQLPKTGGAGLALIVVVGGLFIAAAGIFGLRARRS